MVVIKLIGGVLIVIASSLIGFIKARDFEKRTAELRDIINALQILESEICYKSNILRDALLNCSEAISDNIAIIFKCASELLKNRNMTSDEAWNEALNINAKKTSLKEEDIQILLRLGGSLGTSDYEGQVKNIGFIIKQIEGQIVKADADCIKYQAMYRKLGLLGGVAVVIMLF